jgi:hypothetical protein
MRDAIGADAARLLPQLEQHDFTFLVEDPATVWNLGPQRYPEIARRYQPLTRRSAALAIDINVVERYQDVYPTKQQTGAELFQLVNLASRSFNRVALYFENSIAPVDRALLPAAASEVSRVQVTGGKLIVDSPHGAGVAWDGPALVDGAPWPVADGSTVWLPAGSHLIERRLLRQRRACSISTATSRVPPSAPAVSSSPIPAPPAPWPFWISAPRSS